MNIDEKILQSEKKNGEKEEGEIEEKSVMFREDGSR